MKNKRLLVACSIFMAASPLVGSISNAEASSFLGEFCWNIALTNSEDTETGTLKLAVTDMGANHFIVNGSVNAESTEAINGSAEIVGSNVILTMNAANLDDVDEVDDGVGMSASSWSMKLDLQTLSGTFKAFAQDYYGGGFEPLNYIQGNATFTTCP